MRRIIEEWQIGVSDLPEDLLEHAFGSPRAIVRFYTLHLVLNALCLTGLVSASALFVQYHRQNMYALVVVESIIVVSVGVIVSQSRLLWKTYRNCHLLTQAFENMALRISTRLVHLLRGGTVRKTQMHSLFLVAWLLLCIIFEATAPPCSEFKDLNVWKYKERVIPCELFEFCSSLLFITNSIMGASSRLLPQVVEHLHRRFQPEGNIGLPPALTDLLPVHIGMTSRTPVRTTFTIPFRWPRASF